MSYRSVLMKWVAIKISVASLVLLGMIIVSIVGTLQERYIEVIAVDIALYTIWYIANHLIDLFKPIPIPMIGERK